MLKLVLPMVALAAYQLLPPSGDTYTVSSEAMASLSVPVMVCVACLVILSLKLMPVSAESTKRVTSVDKAVAVLSTVNVLPATADKLPATSTVYSEYVPSLKPVSGNSVSVSASLRVTLFHKVPNAPVMLASLLTLTLLCTK